MSFGTLLKSMFESDGRPRQQNAGNMTPEEKTKEAQRQEMNGAMGAELARSFFKASQSGVTDGSNLTDLGRAYSEQFIPKPQAKPTSAVESLLGVDPSQLPQKAAPGVAPQMIQPPPAPAMNITQPTGTKPGSYQPAQLSFNPGAPSMLANMGLVAPQALPAFTVTQPTGTKPGNYKPTTMTMNAPQPVGPQAMAQIMEAMRLNGGATPFAPYGQA